MTPSIDQLALVHLTSRKPDMQGAHARLYTSFQANGGFEQTNFDRLSVRPTLHFSLQSAVTDHAYGSFEGRQWAIVAPLSEAMQQNGRPETLLSSDVAFFPENGSMDLPGAAVIEFSDALASNVFIEHTGEHLRVAPRITDENLAQAKAWFDHLALEGQNVSAARKMLDQPLDAWKGSQITELGVSAALASINKPNLNHLMGVEPGSAMSFDGWLGWSELGALAKDIEEAIPQGDMGTVKVGRHDGGAGDELFTAVLRADTHSIAAIAGNQEIPARIRDMALSFEQSDLLKGIRQRAIWKELMDGPAKIENDLGQERSGMVSHMTGIRAISAPFEHPTLGQVSLDETMATIRAYSPEERQSLAARMQSRQQEESGVIFQQGAQWIRGFDAPMPPPPPLPPDQCERKPLPAFGGAVSARRSIETPMPPPIPAQRARSSFG